MGKSTFLQDFKAFAMKGNVIDMAVGVVIGMIFFSSLAICFFYLIFGGVFTYAEDFVIISFFCHITITPWRRRRRCL